jgi:hypothetical protein
VSAFSTLFANVGQPVLLDRLGEDVTRYPLAVVADAESPIKGIFEELEPNRDIRTREEVVRRGRLQVASSATASPKDSWLIRSEVWQVLTIESSPGSLRTIHLTRHDKTATRRANGDRLL